MEGRHRVVGWGPANKFISLLLVHTLINYITMTITIYHYLKLCRYIYIFYTIETYLGWYRIMIPAWCEFMADTASCTMDGAYKQMNHDGFWIYGRYIELVRRIDEFINQLTLGGMSLVVYSYCAIGCIVISLYTLIAHILDWLAAADQWPFQDPKKEVLYHIRPYFLGISPYIGLTALYMVGTSNLGSWNGHWCRGLPSGNFKHSFGKLPNECDDLPTLW